MNTVEKAMRYVNKIDSPYLGVYPDMGNITNAAKIWHGCTGRHQNGHRTSGCGTFKGNSTGVFREVRFGTGHVDFPSVIHETWKAGVRRYVQKSGIRETLNGKRIWISQ